ncbi:MAG: histidine phosphatase family protein [Acidobacteria bacterium]|nr:MAG: histidine phosphatase family protein [Acidobacteriota bacterium]
MKGFVATAFAFWLLIAPTVAAAQGAVFVVRHAERADTSADSPLSPVGQVRALRLGAMLKDAGITQIYTTNLQRTVQTAAPLAAALLLTPTEIAVSDLDALFIKLQGATLHDRVLIVGHSNTVPEILHRLGVTTPVTVGETEYDSLFIAIPKEGSPAFFVQLRY